jgi:hypothetical protein
MVEQDYTPSTVTLGHLQKLMKHRFMSAVELEACRGPEDPTLLAPTEGYVVSLTTIYEQGSACLHTSSSTCSYGGAMASSFTT